VQSALKAVDGVDGVEIDFKTKTATVSGSGMKSDALVSCFEGSRFTAKIQE